MHNLIQHSDSNSAPRQWADSYIYKSLSDGSVHEVNNEIFWRKDHCPMPVEYISSPLRDGEQLIGAVLVFSDISQRLANEELHQEHLRKLMQVNAELEEFSFVASHDLQEPMRTLSSYCDFLQEDLGAQVSERVAKDLRYIREAADRMRCLIIGLLELSRVGRMEIVEAPVSLDDCLQDVERSLELLIRETNAVLRIQSLPRVLGDKVQLTRIFQNLIQNALKYRSSATPTVQIFVHEQDQQRVVIAVKDNSLGIDAAYHAQIFGAFKRLHSAAEYTGSGIGLAVVKKLVDRHQGKIWLDSALGQGSTFYVALPRAKN
jgi:light-regulated signal transduction histidine kinase (bacteriophytochrome)